MKAYYYLLRNETRLVFRHSARFGNGFFNRTDHIEGLFGQVVVLAIENFAEATNGVFHVNVTTLQTGKLFRNEERLAQETLNTTSANIGPPSKTIP